jgi:hypothetical protein
MANSPLPGAAGKRACASLAKARVQAESHFLIIGQVDSDSGWYASSAGIVAFSL